MSKKLIFLITFVLVLCIAGKAWAIPFDTATTVWNLHTDDPQADENGPPFSTLAGSGYYYSDPWVDAVTGAEAAEHWDGWAAPSAAYWWSPMYYEDGNEIKPVGAVTFLIRVRLADVDGGDDGRIILSGLYDGSCIYSEYPSYGIEVNDGEPLFVVTEAGQEGDTRTEVGLGQTINTDTWYDMVGTFDPDSDLMTLTVAQSTGGVIGIASIPVAFDELYYSDSAEFEIFVSPCGEMGGAEGDGHIELVAVWIGATPIFGVGVSNKSPTSNEEHLPVDTELCFQAPANALCLWEDDPNDPNDRPPDPNLKGPFEYDVYFGTDPEAMVLIADACQPANCNDIVCIDPCAGDLNLGIWYYWRVDINDANGSGDPCFYEGSVSRFRTLGTAYNPIPVNNQINVSIYTDLTWTGDSFADTYDVYFGTSWADVNDGTAFIQNQGPNTYDPGTLLLATEYFWRIDEVNGATVKGDIWNFTAVDYLIIDGFDSYENDTALQVVWTDYWTNDTGAEIFLEQITTHDGNAMRCDYDNLSKLVGVYGSMTDAVIADLAIGPNWSGVGGKALQLYFYGDVDNSTTVNDKMYLALEDASANAGVLYYPDVNDINVPIWKQWNIDLEDFNSQGVDLTNVSKVAIGFGTYGSSRDQGGTGRVYFDDFSLWRTRCVQALALGDVTGDCIINGYDLQAMAMDWLVADYTEPAIPPSRDGLIVEYLFEGNYSDTSDTPYYHGQPSSSGSSVASGDLYLDGVGYVDIPFGAANPFGGTQGFSISMWFKTSADGLLISSSEPNDVSGCEMSMNVYTGEVENPGEVLYDNVGIGWMGAGTLLNDGEWHHIATTYDAATLQHHIYADGTPETWPDPADTIWDPNITDIATHTVRIGLTYCDDALASAGQFVGYINDVQIYNHPLSHGNVLFLAGKAEPTYFPLDSQANLFPKDGPYGFDPNDRNIIDFRDYSILADHWLEGPTLWP